MLPASVLTGPVRYGFEPEDRAQEAALGAIIAEKKDPGNPMTAFSRAKVRVARHNQKERRWNKFKVGIKDSSRTTDDTAKMNQIYLHELLDFAPFLKGDVQKLLEDGADGREARRVGRLIRENLPESELKD